MQIYLEQLDKQTNKDECKIVELKSFYLFFLLFSINILQMKNIADFFFLENSLSFIALEDFIVNWFRDRMTDVQYRNIFQSKTMHQV